LRIFWRNKRKEEQATEWWYETYHDKEDINQDLI
jgi:hypothetical protein